MCECVGGGGRCCSERREGDNNDNYVKYISVGVLEVHRWRYAGDGGWGGEWGMDNVLSTGSVLELNGCNASRFCI